MFDRIFGGRMNRKNFIWSQVCILIATISIVAVLVVSQNYESLVEISLVAGALSMIPTVAYTVRRLHDLELVGWWSALLFVPYVSIGLLIYLVVKPGTSETSLYGPPDTRSLLDSLLNRIV